MNTRSHILTILRKDGYNDIELHKPIKKQIDSLDATALIITLEDEYKISITDEDRYGCKTFNDLAVLVDSKLIPVSKPRYNTTEQIEWLDKLHFQGDQDSQMVNDIKENLIAVRMMENVHATIPQKHIFMQDFNNMNTVPVCAVCGLPEYNHYNGQ